MATMPAATENTAVKHALVPGTTYYLSLHTTTPGTTGAHEVTGGSYARKAIVFGTPATGQQSSNAQITVTGMPAALVKAIGVWTAASGGTFMWGGALTANVTAPSGSTIKFASGTVKAKIS